MSLILDALRKLDRQNPYTGRERKTLPLPFSSWRLSPQKKMEALLGPPSLSPPWSQRRSLTWQWWESALGEILTHSIRKSSRFRQAGTRTTMSRRLF